ncbi:uncharacterized protein DUF3883 [Salsuginibacillus halophilus]|uniref:Uncharacterized protein DUF3883 n=1 Tax=Salsuginibacillus halophilus TaxID=517424 RepID=A0A2P8H4Z1_9BACI|nr:DUF3578 domain-containing protein [Salsuginibacillus halophilus]PSL41273.1 uncharacterized protein DUF3883 [Salsuginibacillus halophilus]
MKKEFDSAIRELVSHNDDYRKPREDLGYAVVKSDHPLYYAVVKNIPFILQEELKKQNLYNIDSIDVKGSTGDGKVGECYWIALLDKRITTSPTEGMYVVLLFDASLEYLYLSIASGTENLSLSKIKQQTELRRQHFKSHIDKFSSYSEFYTEDIFLGSLPRAKKFAASSCLHKAYKVESLDFEELINDICLLNDLFYEYVYEQYMNESYSLQAINTTETLNFQTNTGIDPKKYASLRKEKEKRDKVTGDKAEELIVNREKQLLESFGEPGLAKKVEWVSQQKDGLGYDISSFFPSGAAKYIEVKGSKFWVYQFTYYISKNELDVAGVLRDSYVLCLVSNIGSTDKDEINIKEIIDPVGKINITPLNYVGKHSMND